ncbi:MAG TPA: transcription-repair coupling factor, partial [Nocardioides sp.]|nr:transcription-repair coupling factor [Nocardioides sp.]
MSLAGLADLVLADPALAAALAETSVRTEDLTGPTPLRPFLVAGLARTGRTVLAVTATTREAEQLTAELGDLLDPATVAYYPSWETLPHERLSPRSDTVGRRLAVLRRLRHPGTDATTGPLSVVVAPVRSLLQPQVKGLGDLDPVELTTGATAEIERVVEGLVGAAYSRVDLVEKRGEFAVRGGIVDVFPPTEDHPVRVEFWGDEVEEIRSFAVADQRTIDKLDRLWAPPCRELLLTPQVRERAAALGRAHPELLEITDKLAQGIAVEGMEALIPVLVDELELLVDLLPSDAQVLVLDPERARARAHDLVATSEEFLGASWAAAASGGQAPIDLQAASYRELGDVRTHALDLGESWWTLSPFGLDDGAVVPDGLALNPPEMGPNDQVRRIQAAPTYHGDVDRALADIAQWHGDGWTVVVMHQGHGPAQRMVEALGERDLPARLVEDLPTGADVNPKLVTVTCGGLAHGLVDEGQRLVIVTGEDIVGAKASTRDK